MDFWSKDSEELGYLGNPDVSGDNHIKTIELAENENFIGLKGKIYSRDDPRII